MEPIKWLLFKLLLKIVGQTGNQVNVSLPGSTSGEQQKIENTDQYQWVFCSTIGELNACKPLINLIAQRGQLVLITDRDCYQESFAQHFPNAIYAELKGQEGEAKALTERFPPQNLYVCEIPCTPNDAPCRLGYGFLRLVKHTGARIVMVNGWLYGYPPSCRQDQIERQLFSKDYLALFDIMTVQTEQIRQTLIQRVANPDTRFVTGNMKFDAIYDIEVSYKDAVSESIVQQLALPQSNTLVAGCLSEPWEYQLLVDSYKHMLQLQASTVMVMAPRHPEKAEQLDLIRKILDDAGLNFEFKSHMTGGLQGDTQVLVLDTFGELRSYYSAADISYMGRNHNILEPLTFGKPVVILSGWEQTYPSFPVYQLALENDLVTQVEHQHTLGDTLISIQQQDLAKHQQKLKLKLSSLATALEQNITILDLAPVAVN
jgi:3-deoxy-D-manno-octulosonic-acid transferase